MKCADPSTWPEPSTQCIHARTPVTERYACAHLGEDASDPKVCAHEGRGSRGPLPIVVGTLVLVEVERLPRGQRRREPRVLWLWWHGPEGEVPNLGACCGAPTSGASTWSILSASSSRLWDGLRLGCATPSRPTGGRGWWWWPLSPSSGWRERTWRIGGCPGSVTTTPLA
jgi:hypothetical protein